MLNEVKWRCKTYIFYHHQQQISCRYLFRQLFKFNMFYTKISYLYVFLPLIVRKIWEKNPINSHNHRRIGKEDYLYEIWLCLVDVLLKAFIYEPTVLLHLPIPLLAYLIAWPHMFTCRKRFPILSPFMPYHQSYTTCTTSGTGTTYPYGASKLIPRF